VISVSGRGSLYSWILSRHPSVPDESPRVVAVIQLEEGPRVVSNLVGTPPDEISNDRAVEVCVSTGSEDVIPQFRVASVSGPTVSDQTQAPSGR
jgi:uncharacterized OB-fold protein